jgi:hypothetical protein
MFTCAVVRNTMALVGELESLRGWTIVNIMLQETTRYYRYVIFVSKQWNQREKRDIRIICSQKLKLENQCLRNSVHY